MNERIESLRARARRSRRVADPEEQRLRQESLAQTEGEPEMIRQAKAFAHLCRRRTLFLHDGELIVGSSAGLEYDPDTATTPQIFGRRTFASAWPVADEVQVLFQEGLLSGAGNHTTMNYEAILATGFDGLVDRIDRRLARLPAAGDGADGDDTRDAREFLQALRLVATGYVDFCRRHADLAVERARQTDDVQRRGELEAIATHCRQVPAAAPRTFWEACQALWFCFFFLPDAPGRVDQYLYPFYTRDRARGAIDPDRARELLGCLWIRYFEWAGAQAGVSAHQHLTLGGVAPDGSDAGNELTWLCLDVTEDLCLHRPQVGLRCNRNSPPELLDRAVCALRNRSGNPDFCNDEQIVPALVRIGVRPEDARDFSLSGCHEVIVTGRAQMGSVEGFINMPKILRLALGLEPGVYRGTDVATIDTEAQLWAALTQAMEHVAEGAHQASLARDRQAAAEPGGNLTASLVVDDCIDNARGYTQGGARYNFCNWDIIGLANLVDSLMAIRRLVFGDGAVALPRLVDTLRRDWCDGEGLRQNVLHRLPHFGNDQDEVDAEAARLIETFGAILEKRTEPLADSLGAAQGRDRQGVTALLNSVSKLPHRLLPTATTLNVKLDPALLRDAAGVGKVAALIRAHFQAGGQQCQFNMVDREMLLEAKRHPEKHGDLMVRVAGYSAPFASLWEDLQDEIIARTGHAL